MRRTLSLLAMIAPLAMTGCPAIQRKLLFFPTHHTQANGLAPWTYHGAVIGYSRTVGDPENIWLMLHGNAGQASDRAYALPAFSAGDSVFVLEYPGYGQRGGEPSREAFDAAAVEAYRALRRSFPRKPVCVMGESIGSGPACVLAQEATPPDKLVLVVPFDELRRVAADHFPRWSVGLILGATWNNVESLSAYRGPIDVFGATGDTVISIYHARVLADSVQQARFHAVAGGHNEWSSRGEVQIRNP